MRNLPEMQTNSVAPWGSMPHTVQICWPCRSHCSQELYWRKCSKTSFIFWGAWVSQSVECPTLRFQLRSWSWVVGSNPMLCTELHGESACGFLSSSPSAPTPMAISLSLSNNKSLKKTNNKASLIFCLPSTHLFLKV